MPQVTTVTTKSSKTQPKQKNNTKQTTIVVAKDGGRRRRKRTRKPPQAHPGRPVGRGRLGRFLACLADPFMNPPIRLGLGVAQATTIWTGYTKGSLDVNGTDGCATILINPEMNVGGGATFPIYTDATTAGATAWVAVPWSNLPASSVFGNGADIRCLAMGIRVWVSHAATVKPGLFQAGMFHDSYSLLSASSYTAFTGKFDMNYVPESQDLAGVFASVRPVSAQAFEFSDGQTGISTAVNSLFSRPVIIYKGDVTSTLYYEVIGHFEVLHGADASIGLPSDITDSVADDNVSSELLIYNIRKAGPPVMSESTELHRRRSQRKIHAGHTFRRARGGLSGSAHGPHSSAVESGNFTGYLERDEL
jgi:hypothetical protein